MQQNIVIRQTTGQDMPGVMAIPGEALGQDDEAKLAAALPGDPGAPPCLSLAARSGDTRMAITRLRAWQAQYTTRSL